MDETIVQAIRHKRRLSFEYSGQSRTVEPHACGFSKSGKELLLAYQIAGGHTSGHREPWHMFHVDRMSSLQVTGHFSGPRDDYRKGSLHAIVEEL